MILPQANDRAADVGATGDVLIDADVLLDVFTQDPTWFDWSACDFADVAERASLVINPLSYADASVRFAHIKELEEALPTALYRRESLPWEAAFLARKAHVEYRRRGGPRRLPLPDLYIGAHAAVRGYTLLTRNAARYRTYFPGSASSHPTATRPDGTCGRFRSNSSHHPPSAVPMPVDQKRLLADCQRQLKFIEADLKSQADELPDLDADLRAEYEMGREAGRVGDAFEIWRIEQAIQAAVHWVLGGVFVRFLEDNGLIDPLIAGAGDRGRLAEAAEQAFYTAHPTLHERDWLLQAFRTVAALPGGTALFDEAHNPAFRWPLSPDAAKSLVRFWRRPDPETGGLAHDFVDAAWDTRFLGDLYQDLSEGARKKYALLQTPVFVEEFILERTLGEALKVLPLPKVTVIDPTIGSGHFALGAFARLLAAWEAKEPGALREDLAQRALDQVAGVDLNPFAVAIARFRLLIAALRACGVMRLERAPAFRLNVAVGDTLLHGGEPGELVLGDGGRGRYVRHAFGDEDLAAVNAILGRRYAVVVGNPPYITPKDPALRIAYKERYKTCHMKYALSVPFVERFWELAAADAGSGIAGWVGQITSNSFMKREFGKKLIEEFFPRVDLTHVLDTAGAYIPGHGTPTVMLFGRARCPQSDVVRAALGIQGEPATPDDPAHGEVWSAMVGQLDEVGSESAYVSVADVQRAVFSQHPWALSGGGAGDVKAQIEAKGERTLDGLGASVGITSFTLEDGAYLLDPGTVRRLNLENEYVRPMRSGDELRDWTAVRGEIAIFPYDAEFRPAELGADDRVLRYLWPSRTRLSSNVMFGGQSKVESGLRWYEYGRLASSKLRVALSLAFAEVATHNHFVLDRGGVVFKQTAPVIKLPAGTDEVTHLGLLGLLNSSTACFWLKQVAHNKGSTVDQAGARQRTAPFEDFYQFNGTKVGAFPVPVERPVDLAEILDDLARERKKYLPSSVVASGVPSRGGLDSARDNASIRLAHMIAAQEELDWRCYRLYGVTSDELTYRDTYGNIAAPPPLALGERAFEIVLARRMAAGQEESSWFARHGSTPTTTLPAHWPADYRALVERRIAAIQSARNIALIELPEHKRRWNVESWETMEQEALALWLLDRLESPVYWPHVTFQTTRDLAQRAALDPDFVRVADLWAGTEGVALEPVIRELTLGEAVPFLPALRYSESGRVKRAVWERTWELQREEDVVDAVVAAELTRLDGESEQAFAGRLAAAKRVRCEAVVGPNPRPPKYVSKDFQPTAYWRLRGTLDVPKERFILYPFCNHEGDDAPLLGWAGWNHLQQAEALSTWYADRTQRDGWSGERVTPMLAGMAELVPWLLQWHNDLDPVHGDRPGETYATWLDTELQAQGLTRDDLRSWEPPRTPRRGGRRAGAKRTAAAADVTE